MSMESIRKAYNVPAKRGRIVMWTDCTGHLHLCKIIGSDLGQRLVIRPISDQKTRLRVHPADTNLRY